MAAANRMPLLLTRTATATGLTFEAPGPGATVHARVTGTGAVSATVVVQVSNYDGNWLNLGTLTLSGTDTASAGLALDAHWAYIRADLTAISGTGASVDVIMGTRD
jgi:hypothetical protein